MPELLRCVGYAPRQPAVGGGGLAASAESGTGGGGWDHEVSPFQLPPGVEVMMADVSCGANTPSMVKKVNAWRKSSSEAATLWQSFLFGRCRTWRSRHARRLRPLSRGPTRATC